MERTSRNHLISALFALFFALSSFASPLGTTYQARIVKPDGLALESANVNFKFTILNPAGTCILYAETFSTINMANSGGMISFALGSGVKTYPASATTFAQVFNNSTASLSCDAGGPVSYSPTATDIRKIVMQFNDGNGWQTLPAMAINAVPYAIYSSDSLSLGGVSATNYVQYSTIPTCAVSEALHYNGTSFNCVSVASGGGGASYTVTSSDVTSALGYTPANQSSVATSFTTVTNSLSTVGTSFTTVTSTINSLGSSVTAIASTVNSLSASLAALTSSQWQASSSDIYYSSGRVGVGTSAPATKFAVGDSLTKPSAILQNVTSATIAEFNATQTLTSGQTGAVTINSVAAPMSNSTAVDAGLTVDLRVEASQTASVGSRVGIMSLNTHDGPNSIAEMYGQFNVIRNANGGNVAGMGGNASIVQNVSGTASNAFGEMLNVVNMPSGNISIMTGSIGTIQNAGTAGNLSAADYTVTNSKQATNLNGLVARITNEASATRVVGVHSEIQNTINGAANAQDIIGLYSNIQNHSGASVTNVYGLYLEKYMSTPAINDYGIFQRDSGKNYFAGRIGIGTSSPVTALDVSGGVRVGTESATCAVSYAGTLRYMASNIEYCNGTSWQAFGVGGATTSSSIVSALGYTPANSSTVAASMTAVTNSVATNSSSITALTSTVTTHTSSLTALAASMSAVTSSQWVTSGTAILYSGGNVGIGPNLPRQKLDVAPATGNSIIRATSTNATAALQLYRNTAGAYAGPVLWSNGTSLNFGYDNTENAGATLMTLETNGALGIGTTSPSYPVDVWTGNAFAARYLHASNNAYDDAAIMMVRARGTPSSQTAVLNNDSIGGMYFRAHDGTGTNSSTAHIEVSASENQSPTNRGNIMTFATTQNGQAARQEIMRIHSNGFVGIGNTTPNALLQVGPSGPMASNYNVYVASYNNSAGQGQYVGNWRSDDYWALGPATTATDKTLRLGIASDRTGTWHGTQDLNLLVGGHVNVGGNLNVSGTVAGSANLVPASAILLMQSCPTGWTDTGATGGGPGTVTCDGVSCRMCQTATAALVPPSAKILMESCPSGWANLGKAGGPAAAGYTLNAVTVPMITCESPATASVLTAGLRFMTSSCPASWKDIGGAAGGPSSATCSGVSCRVCEVPGGSTNQTVFFAGNASGTSAHGPDVFVLAGKGGATLGSGGSVSIRGGAATDGAGGGIDLTAGDGATTTALANSGGNISITGGNTTANASGGAVYINSGYSSFTGSNVYANTYVNPNGGNVGIGSATAVKLLHIQKDQNSDTALLIRNLSSGTTAMSALDIEAENNGVQLIAYSTTATGSWGGNTVSRTNTAALRTYTTLPVSSMLVGTGSPSPLHLMTSDTPRVTVGSTGNVGIGTINPIEALHIQKGDVNGAGFFIQKDSSSFGLTLGTHATSNKGYIQGSNSTNTGNGELLLNPFGSNVGIGTASPTTLLHVANTATVTNPLATLESTGAGGRPYLKFRAENIDYGYVGFGSTGNATMALMNYQAGPLYLGTSSTARMVIDSTGSFAMGGIFAPAGQMANTSINLGDGGTIAATAGSGIGPGGLSWQATAGGYTGNFFNSGSASNANGLQVYTASVDAATYILNVRSNGSSRMVVKGDGRVGIGNASPAAALDVTGDIRGTGTVATWSDQRAKKNITTIPDSLNRVLKLRGVNFDWRTDEFPDKKFKTTRDMGVIAQEVEKVFPEAVNTSSDSFKSVSYSLLVAPLIEAVKELYYKITGVEHKVDRAVASVEQKADKLEVDALKAENAELKKRLDRLEKLMLENQKSK
ncbi:tail fiber domain-containing protein [Pseudobdellovibrio sp. HCB154]|uniref:tail fiber domain-containing protein n=1 Tax=Pseudobdellovibrio sp. HCB154 TaxID=3386277 RepID=UPI0039175750